MPSPSVHTGHTGLTMLMGPGTASWLMTWNTDLRWYQLWPLLRLCGGYTPPWGPLSNRNKWVSHKEVLALLLLTQLGDEAVLNTAYTPSQSTKITGQIVHQCYRLIVIFSIAKYDNWQKWQTSLWKPTTVSDWRKKIVSCIILKYC